MEGSAATAEVSSGSADVGDASDVSAEVSEGSVNGSAKGGKSAGKSKAVANETPQSLEAMKREAQIRFQEAAKMRKENEAQRAEIESLREQVMSSKSEIEQFLHLAQTNPRALERIWGPEVARKIAEDLLYKHYEESKLTPEQVAAKKQREQDEEDLRRYRESEKLAKETEEKTKAEKESIERVKVIDEQIAKGVQEYGLPISPALIKIVANHLEAQLESEEELNVEKALPAVHQTIRQMASNYFESLPIEQFVEEFPDVAEALRKHDLAKQPNVPSFKRGFVNPEADEQKESAKPRKTIDDWFKSL